MKIGMVWTRLVRTISVTTCKESERVMSSLLCLHAALCHLDGKKKRFISAWLFQTEAGAPELFQCVRMETGKTETINNLNA